MLCGDTFLLILIIKL